MKQVNAYELIKGNDYYIKHIYNIHKIKGTFCGYYKYVGNPRNRNDFKYQDNIKKEGYLYYWAKFYIYDNISNVNINEIINKELKMKDKGIIKNDIEKKLYDRYHLIPKKFNYLPINSNTFYEAIHYDTRIKIETYWILDKSLRRYWFNHAIDSESFDVNAEIKHLSVSKYIEDFI